jgi:hypothetical protein
MSESGTAWAANGVPRSIANNTAFTGSIDAELLAVVMDRDKAVSNGTHKDQTEATRTALLFLLFQGIEVTASLPLNPRRFRLKPLNRDLYSARSNRSTAISVQRYRRSLFSEPMKLGRAPNPTCENR